MIYKFFNFILKLHIMHIWVLPSSGGKFPNQIGLLSEVCGNLDKPSIICGTSGGQISAFIALASDYSCNYIKSELFSHSWWPHHLNFMPSWIIGTFKGSIYKAGSGGENVMKHIFTPYNITQCELWIGTTESISGKAQLFCNKCQEDSILGNVEFDFKLRNCKPHKFLNGDVTKIAKVSTASAAIPVYIPSVIIDDIEYSDGGSSFWSSLSPLSESIDLLCKDQKLHLTYFNSCDIESECDIKCNTNIVRNTDTTIERILKTLAITDRLAGIDLIRKHKDYQILYFEGKCNSEVLQKIQSHLKYVQRSFLELYPKHKAEIDITNFEPADIHKIISDTRKCYYFRLWIAVASENVRHMKNEFSAYL
jgi:hypothetical protein